MLPQAWLPTAESDHGAPMARLCIGAALRSANEYMRQDGPVSGRQAMPDIFCSSIRGTAHGQLHSLKGLL